MLLSSLKMTVSYQNIVTEHYNGFGPACHSRRGVLPNPDILLKATRKEGIEVEGIKPEICCSSLEYSLSPSPAYSDSPLPLRSFLRYIIPSPLLLFLHYCLFVSYIGFRSQKSLVLGDEIREESW